MSELEFEVANYKSQQTLGELELWKPPQGTVRQLIPLDLELRFDEHIVRNQTGNLLVTLSCAHLQLVLEGLEIVRGSRLGDKLNDPYEVAELTRSVRENLETETELGYSADLELSKDIFGKICAIFKWRRNKRKDETLDNLIKSTVSLYRVIARPGNRWRVVEPVAPYSLKGRYLGVANSTEGSGRSMPLCLLSAKSLPAKAKIFLRAGYAEFVVKKDYGNRGVPLSRNKEAVIGQIARLSLSSSDGSTFGVQESPDRSGVLLCRSELTCRMPKEVRE